MINAGAPKAIEIKNGAARNIHAIRPSKIEEIIGIIGVKYLLGNQEGGRHCQNCGILVTVKTKKDIGSPSIARVAKFIAILDNINSCGVARVRPQAMLVEEKKITADNDMTISIKITKNIISFLSRNLLFSMFFCS